MLNKKIKVGVVLSVVVVVVSVIISTSCCDKNPTADNNAVTNTADKTEDRPGQSAENPVEKQNSESEVATSTGDTDTSATESSPESTNEKNPVTIEEKDAMFKERMNLNEPDKDSVAQKMMRDYSAEELRLFAAIQRKTKKKAPQEVKLIIDEYRKKVGYEALLKKSNELLADDMIVRAITSQWLRTVYGIETKKPDKNNSGDIPSIRGSVDIKQTVRNPYRLW